MSGMFVVVLQRIKADCPSCGAVGTVSTEIPGGTVVCLTHAPWCRIGRVIGRAGEPRPDGYEPLPIDDRGVRRR